MRLPLPQFLAATALAGGWIGLPARGAAPGVHHVVIIGIDGLTVDGLRRADAPNLHALIKEGAHTFHARGVMPTVSSPNWASIIMGAGPEQHGVTSNGWRADQFDIAPTALGPGGRFPTIFGVMRQQRPDAVMACFYEWEGFGELPERNVLNVLQHGNGAAETIGLASAYVRQSKPALTFIHLDLVDHAGHSKGYGSGEYLEAVAEADRLIGKVIATVKEAGLGGDTILLVVADHGGIGTRHGGTSMAEIEVPWIIAGRGTAAGTAIPSPVNTFDTAATVAYIFGLAPPDCWIGRPVRKAFGE